MSRADRPDGFVGDTACGRLFGLQARQSGAHLVADERFGLVGLAYGQALAHADDRLHAGLHKGAHLAIDLHIGLGEHLAALGMADDAPRASHILEHGDADFAREGSRRLPMHVLRAHVDVRLVEIKHRNHGTQVDRGRTQHHVHLVPTTGVAIRHALGKHHAFRRRHVHFPVACDDGFAHHTSLLCMRLTYASAFRPCRTGERRRRKTPRRTIRRGANAPSIEAPRRREASCPRQAPWTLRRPWR